MPGPAATITHMHTCPMWSGNTPHVGGPVIGPGIPTVLIGGKPAAVMGDQCTCSGPPDVIVKGEATVLIGGKPAATMGSTTAHGGVITVGEPTVLFGTGGSGATAVMAVKKIPFPKISLINKILGNNKEAIANQEAIKEEAENTEGDPKIYGIRIQKKETSVRESMVNNMLTIKAHVLNIDDGQTINFKVTIPPNAENEEEQVLELSGTVEDKEVSVDWTPEKKESNA